MYYLFIITIYGLVDQFVNEELFEFQVITTEGFMRNEDFIKKNTYDGSRGFDYG